LVNIFRFTFCRSITQLIIRLRISYTKVFSLKISHVLKEVLSWGICFFSSKSKSTVLRLNCSPDTFINVLKVNYDTHFLNRKFVVTIALTQRNFRLKFNVKLYVTINSSWGHTEFEGFGFCIVDYLFDFQVWISSVRDLAFVLITSFSF